VLVLFLLFRYCLLTAMRNRNLRPRTNDKILFGTSVVYWEDILSFSPLFRDRFHYMAFPSRTWIRNNVGHWQSAPNLLLYRRPICVCYQRAKFGSIWRKSKLRGFCGYLFVPTPYHSSFVIFLNGRVWPQRRPSTVETALRHCCVLCTFHILDDHERSPQAHQ
jgi:hypothetical protein